MRNKNTIFRYDLKSLIWGAIMGASSALIAVGLNQTFLLPIVANQIRQGKTNTFLSQFVLLPNMILITGILLAAVFFGYLSYLKWSRSK